MHRDSPPFEPLNLVRDIGARAVLSGGLAGIGLIHLLDAIGKYHESRYVFWMYIALILGSVVTAGAVLFTRCARRSSSRPGSPRAPQPATS